MFTGIVEEVGQIAELTRHGDSAVLRVTAAHITTDLVHGASIAVNGVCLTVVGWDAAPGPDTSSGAAIEVSFDVMGETLARSVVGGLRPGDRVNLERAVRADARLDGHIVQGHVDGTGAIVSRTPATEWETVRIAMPGGLAGFVAEKGSIAVDGVSLTVSAVGPDWFEVGLIPETLRATTLGGKAPGDPVNLEVDVLAKYVARLLDARS